jgi:23S rRNA (guanine2445-N2)-methyltransferase
MKNSDIIVKTLFGFEELLATELRALEATDIEVLNRAVKCTGSRALLYKINLLSRTALRVLVPIASFTAYNEDKLYKKVRGIEWSAYLGVDQTFAIDATTHSEIFNHSKYVALKCKDAIADQFRDKFGRRPSVDTEDPDLRINIHISDKLVNIALDSSGDHLDRRGYRLSRTEAPINEVLAAGIILMTGWDGQSHFIDPMCGSGTFAIEAAMMASHTPPGMLRHFAFEKWSDFDARLWREIRAEAEAKISPSTGKIVANDIDGHAVSMARQNAARAGVGELVTFANQDFLATHSEAGSGVVVMNPPYGERMQHDDLTAFYNETGTRLKHFYEGFDAWIISSDLRALKFIGLRPSRKIALFNGSLECRLHKFELYRGSKKGK